MILNQIHKEVINGINFWYLIVEDMKSKDMKIIADQMKKDIKSGCVVVMTTMYKDKQ